MNSLCVNFCDPPVVLNDHRAVSLQGMVENLQSIKTLCVSVYVREKEKSCQMSIDNYSNLLKGCSAQSQYVRLTLPLANAMEESEATNISADNIISCKCWVNVISEKVCITIHVIMLGGGGEEEMTVASTDLPIPFNLIEMPSLTEDCVTTMGTFNFAAWLHNNSDTSSKDSRLLQFRIPYADRGELHQDMRDSIPLSLLEPCVFTPLVAPAQSVAPQRCIRSVQMHCANCNHLLVPRGNITRVAELPSGIFDQMIHEFVCSEELSGAPLQLADVKPLAHEMYSSNCCYCINPKDMVQLDSNLPTCAFTCKTNNTLLDCVFGFVGALLILPVYSSNATLLSPLIDVNTCSVNCSNCGTVVGDGVFSVDTDDAGDTDVAASVDIHHADLCTIRLLASGVRCDGYTHSPTDNVTVPTNSEFCLLLSLEQMISRTIQQLSEKHGMVNMVLYCMSTVGKRSSVILKILSREVQVVLPNDCCSPSDPVPCMPALKLAFCVPDLSMVNEGEGVGGQTGAISYRDAIHIPLPAADWQKVHSLLASRSVHLFGSESLPFHTSFLISLLLL